MSQQSDTAVHSRLDAFRSAHERSADRFHALDATRAFALLLGVVFHASWSFVPAPIGAPIVDNQTNRIFDWFFFTSHTFRMQLFFLIAGFFAHMVYHRRGFAAFAKNRLLRIALPLVMAWFVLYPLVTATWVAGANVSGRNLVNVPLPIIFSLMYEKGLMFVPRKLGGLFSLTHLWFLYYLLCLYPLLLGLRFVLTRHESLAAGIRRQADLWVGRAMTSPWGIAWLACGVGLLLWPMSGWFGVDTPVRQLLPSIPVLVLYGFFFASGWILHRRAELLTATVRHWPWQLGLGVILSIPVFLSYQSVRDRGAAGSVFAHYPDIQALQFTDWPAFLTRLQTANAPLDRPGELTHLWQHLPLGARTQILKLSNSASPDERAGVAAAIQKLLPQPAMFSPEPIPGGFVPPMAEAREAKIRNRATLERLFPNSLSRDPRRHAWYLPAKLAYSIGYALVLWLLLFGTLGFFHSRCANPSPAWRYVADSSYWMYLAHLPLVGGLQIWIAEWNVPALLKFLFLNAVAFTVLFASYHYLVRSTLIGRILNGRTHPFAAWPFGRKYPHFPPVNRACRNR